MDILTDLNQYLFELINKFNASEIETKLQHQRRFWIMLNSVRKNQHISINIERWGNTYLVRVKLWVRTKSVDGWIRKEMFKANNVPMIHQKTVDVLKSWDFNK